GRLSLRWLFQRWSRHPTAGAVRAARFLQPIHDERAQESALSDTDRCCCGALYAWRRGALAERTAHDACCNGGQFRRRRSGEAGAGAVPACGYRCPRPDHGVLVLPQLVLRTANCPASLAGELWPTHGYTMAVTGGSY